MGVELKAGEHVLELDYMPDGLKNGAYISGISAAFHHTKFHSLITKQAIKEGGKKRTPMKLWGGRFTKETNQLVHNFNASISFDQKFYHPGHRGQHGPREDAGEAGDHLCGGPGRDSWRDLRGSWRTLRAAR